MYKEYVIKSKLYNVQQWEPETAKRKLYFFIFILKGFFNFKLIIYSSVSWDRRIVTYVWRIVNFYAWSLYPTRTLLNLILKAWSLSYVFPCRVWPSRDIKEFKLIRRSAIDGVFKVHNTRELNYGKFLTVISI